uniref:N-acetyl-gamma-glutamyl-phosphate reductase n=1 Tax=Solanum tuberosum TaxID=4113 RepID=M1CFY9_SOLTU
MIILDISVLFCIQSSLQVFVKSYYFPTSRECFKICCGRVLLAVEVLGSRLSYQLYPIFICLLYAKSPRRKLCVIDKVKQGVDVGAVLYPLFLFSFCLVLFMQSITPWGWQLGIIFE